MKVFDLVCHRGHGFEGWFSSEDDHRQQVERGLLTCPVCNSPSVTRRPSAPRLNLHHARGDVRTASADATASGGAPSQTQGTVARTSPVASPVDPSSLSPQVAERLAGLQVAYEQMVRHVLTQTEDVGPRFAEEARRIHYGETEARGIRGQSSNEDLSALREEGIEVLSLPIPAGLDKPVH